MTLICLAMAHGSAKAGDEQPALVIGSIELERDNLFTPEEIAAASSYAGLVRRTMNRLHMNTRPHVLQREFLFQEGEPFRPELLAETERNLRALGYLADVSVAPIDTTAAGQVRIRVHTRETWTLETNVSYTLAAGGQQRWRAQLSDKNFLGRGVTVGGGLGRDLTSDFWNLWYRQRRLPGTTLNFGLDYAQRGDGHSRQLAMARPFFALADPAAFEARGWDARWNRRYYLSNGGPAGSDARRPASLYASLPFDEIGVEMNLQMRVSPPNRGRVWRLGAGVRVFDQQFFPESSRQLLSDGRYVDLGWLMEEDPVYRRDQGVTVYPYLWLRTVGRRWVKAHYVLQYGPLEDLDLDWDADLKAGPAGGNVGSTTAAGAERWRFEGRCRKWMAAGPGHLLVMAEGEAESGSDPVRHHRWNAVAGWAGARGPETAPWLARVFVEAGQGARLSGARALLLGLDRGIRTLDVDGMAGDRLVRWNVECGRATTYTPMGLFRLGLAAFYNGGSAWWENEDRSATDLRHEVGIGLRAGPVRSTNTAITRIDLTRSLDGGGFELTASTGGLF